MSKVTMDEAKDSVYDIRSDVTIEDKKCVFMNTSLTVTCEEGHKFSMKYKHLLDNRKCPVCFPENDCKFKLVSFSPKYAELYWDEAVSRRCTVYVIRLTDNNESFYKIGITTGSTEHRCKSFLPYESKILAEIPLSLYDGIYMEKHLHNVHREFSYNPQIGFKGSKKECFLKIKKYIIEPYLKIT